jgi:oligopeptide transport system substrate-binding protein
MRKLLFGGVAALALAAVSSALAQEAKPGGEIVVTYQNDVATLDPAIGYDWQNWSMIKSLFDGLMDYEAGTATLRTDLAESYEISPDGLTFTFKLHPGVKFHNGRELTADDVKYSIERVLDPATQSPGAGFFGSIKTISVVDPLTIKFELSRPDATFLHVMAINFAHVVPKEAVDEFGADFGKHPVGTGAYKLAEWTLGQRVVFEKNPDYWRDGVPYLDKITFEIGVEPTVALLRLQQGEVDVLGDGIPPAQFLQVKDDPQYEGWIVEGGQLHTGYVTMNVKTPPFDNAQVRQAVNMAINKDRIVRIINNRAVPANQPLPPSMPGYDTSYAGYAYDPEKAKALLAEAGYPDGFPIRFVASTGGGGDVNRVEDAQWWQRDFAKIGVSVTIDVLDNSTFWDLMAAGMPNGTGFMDLGWGESTAAWLDQVIAAGALPPGGFNAGHYDNPEIDKHLLAARSAATEEEMEAELHKVQDIIGKDHAWLPTYTPVATFALAANVSGFVLAPEHWSDFTQVKKE